MQNIRASNSQNAYYKQCSFVRLIFAVMVKLQNPERSVLGGLRNVMARYGPTLNGNINT